MDHADRDDRVCRAGSERSRTVEQIAHRLETGVLERKAGQGVLDDGILHVILTQLGAQLGVFIDGDALVVDEHAGAGAVEPFSQSGDDRLLLTENFCVRHSVFSPPCERYTPKKNSAAKAPETE